MMIARWKIHERGLSLVIPRAEFEAEMQRAIAWQIEFDSKVNGYRFRYQRLPRWRQLIYQWLGIGLGLAASPRFIRRRVSR